MTVQGSSDFIQRCVQNQHFEPATLKNYRHDFRNHPNRVIRIKNFLKPTVAERLSKFALHEAQYQRLYAIRSNHGELVSFESWITATAKQRLYCCWEANAKIADEFRISQNWLSYMFWSQSIANNSPVLLGLLEEATGYALTGFEPVTLRKMTTGDFLGKHADRDGNRCLAWLLYLSPDWQKEHGGLLHITDWNKRTSTYSPLYNSLLVFDVHKQKSHHVPEINPAAGKWQRITLGSWVNGRDKLEVGNK